ncbi:TrkA family potassium uptake protein [Anaerocolumna sp. AGMB13025]|uniref:potassium channel family protein n=1 Tax=Anaerocolumna sp. AGMB13025 TaxID=3039116 RepID=UPI00241D9D52|nr:TrkA family potassium uptake protein [Anaerocolumna sp. AGMB13025]WFR60056.1 TrkA family potassium uptake protein [Anaerocolumna sp. AGMB13025]
MYIIIIGCGRLGSNLARELADEGHDVSIIDRNSDRLSELGSGFNGQRIKGIEYDKDKLLEAGIEQTDTLLAVTNDDNINITVSLIADKIYSVKKIIARINNPGKNYIYDKLNIKTINPIRSEIEVLKSKLFIENLNVVSTIDSNYEIIDVLINKEKGMTVEEIEIRYFCVISVLTKFGISGIPKKDEVIHSGDRMICAIHKKDKEKLINSFSREIIL